MTQPRTGTKKRRKQAEFLVHGALPWPEVSHIVVRTEAIAGEVAAIIFQSDHKPEMLVQRGWYY